MIKAIIFDLQGTLVEHGVYPSPLKQAKYFFRINENFHEFVPKFERVFMTKKYESLPDALKEAAAEFHSSPDNYAYEKLIGVWNKNKLLSKVFPDTIETLEKLKGKYKLILVANIDCFTKDIIEKFKLNEYFDLIELSCDTGKLKSDKDFFLTPLKKLKIKPEDALVVGDSMQSDIDGAKVAGIPSVLIDRNDTRQEYPERILTLKELDKYLGE